jgi:chromosome segregation ATPase
MNDSHEERLAIVERDLRTQAEAGGRLSTMERGLGSLNTLMQSVALTQSEQIGQISRLSTTFREHTLTLAEHTALLRSIDGRFDERTAMLKSVNKRLGTIEDRVASVDDKLDRLIAVLERPSQGG